MIESIYNCLSIIQQIDEKAEANEGELAEEDMQALVVAQTTSMEKLSSLVGYMKHLEAFEATCKAEKQRITARQQTAQNRLQSIKKYLTPYIQEVGRKTVGTHTLSLRKSQAVELDEGFSDTRYGKNKVVFMPDKKKIKEELKARPELVILGAELVNRLNLQIR